MQFTRMMRGNFTVWGTIINSTGPDKYSPIPLEGDIESVKPAAISRNSVL